MAPQCPAIPAPSFFRMTSGSLLLLALALLLMGSGLFRFSSPALRRAGLAAFWLASGTVAWALTGSPWLGAGVLLLLVLFPLSEMMVMLRRLRIPARRRLRDIAPPLDTFPDLAALTGEMEALDFRLAGDCRLEPALDGEQDQLFRLFEDGKEGHHGLLGFISQGGVGFGFAAFSSEDRRGRQWVTWNYPLSYGLKVPPEMVIHRDRHCDGLPELLQAHRELLRLNGVAPADLAPPAGADAGAARARLEQSLASQLRYNLGIGILAPDGADGGAAGDSLRYSWRGAFAIAAGAVRDLVRM